MTTIKRFLHVFSGKYHDYVEGGTLEGHEVVMIYSKGVCGILWELLSLTSL